MQSILGEGGAVHTPYGATECLPVASISSLELTEDLQARTRNGEGTCVGTPVPPNEVKILRVLDEPMEVLHPEDLLPTGHLENHHLHDSPDRSWISDGMQTVAPAEDGNRVGLGGRISF